MVKLGHGLVGHHTVSDDSLEGVNALVLHFSLINNPSVRFDTVQNGLESVHDRVQAGTFTTLELSLKTCKKGVLTTDPEVHSKIYTFKQKKREVDNGNIGIETLLRIQQVKLHVSLQ